MWSKIWNWIKSLFNKALDKKFSLDTITEGIKIVDLDKDGKVSLREIIKAVKEMA